MPIYLDYNATAPLRHEVVESVLLLDGLPANPSSVHYFGRQARFLIDEARLAIAHSLGVSPHELIFTSGGTESNNMVIANFDQVITSAVEHDAVLAACPGAMILPVNKEGQICLEALDRRLSALPEDIRPRTLVSIMAANNETGIIHPLGDVVRLCKHHQIACHSDMVQFLGKSPIDLHASGLDFASFSAHKIGGPSGIGALWCHPGRHLTSLLSGGGQERGRRAGTENIIGIHGFGAAVKRLDIDAMNAISSWRDNAEALICEGCPDIEVIGSDVARLANTSALYLPKIEAQTAVMKLDLAGFAVSAGAACSSGKLKPSHVIAAMGRGEAAAHVIRISAGWKTEESDFLGVARAIIEFYKHY